MPRDSAWFSFFNGTDLVPLREQPIYKEASPGGPGLERRGRRRLRAAPRCGCIPDPPAAAPAAAPRPPPPPHARAQDWIGLRALDARGALHLESVPGEHMQFTLAWFRREVVGRWLGGGDDDE